MQKDTKKLLSVLLLTGMVGSLQAMDIDTTNFFSEEAMQVVVTPPTNTVRQAQEEKVKFRNDILALLNGNFDLSTFIQAAVNIERRRLDIHRALSSSVESERHLSYDFQKCVGKDCNKLYERTLAFYFDALEALVAETHPQQFPYLFDKGAAQIKFNSLVSLHRTLEGVSNLYFFDKAMIAKSNALLGSIYQACNQ